MEKDHTTPITDHESSKDAIEDTLSVETQKLQRMTQSGALRAAVLGINDGLVSNFSLVMGVYGGTDNPKFVLLAGIAGLLAGAFSMATGEYVSMRSQRDIYERALEIEAQELTEKPEEEREELALIYQKKGFSRKEAATLSAIIMSNSEMALETHAREEIGVTPAGLGSPWGSAGSSFGAFFIGALIPILPYLFGAGGPAFLLSIILSGGSLAIVGSLLAFLSGKRIWWGGLRMLIAGSIAATFTFAMGNLVGILIAG